jgi:hypothetical protein
MRGYLVSLSYSTGDELAAQNLARRGIRDFSDKDPGIRTLMIGER